jgi:hypothetical protein
MKEQYNLLKETGDMKKPGMLMVPGFLFILKRLLFHEFHPPEKLLLADDPQLINT